MSPILLPMLLAAQAAVAPPATLGATDQRVDRPIAAPARAPDVADEFDGPRIDLTLWRFDMAQNKTGWFNHEKQYYGPANARIRDGALVIEARAERATAADSGGQAYTSAKLVSRRAFGYGFYEIRARLPCGRGTWPAIWLLPSSGRWPAAGEIDVMEMVGWDPNVVHATVHSAAYNHVKGTQRGAQVTVPTACTAYHRYQLDDVDLALVGPAAAAWQQPDRGPAAATAGQHRADFVEAIAAWHPRDELRRAVALAAPVGEARLGQRLAPRLDDQ